MPRGALLQIATASRRAAIDLNLLLRLVERLRIVHEVVHRTHIAIRYRVLVMVATWVDLVFLLQAHFIDWLETGSLVAIAVG